MHLRISGLLVYALFSSFLPGQEIVRDLRPYRSVVTHLVADQTITARLYTIQFHQTSELSPDGLSQEAVRSASRDALQTGLQAGPGLGLVPQSLSTALGAVASGTLAIGMAYNFAAFYAEVANTQSRSYQFYLPVSGMYRISCSLVGGIDYPRNRVRMIGSNGSVIDYQDQLAFDSTIHFYQFISHGSYTITLSLGSGSSSVFHNAGTLSSVLLDDPNWPTWTTPVLVAQARGDLPAYIGSTVTYQVSHQGFPTSLSGLSIGSFSFSNLRPATAAVLGSLDGSTVGAVRAVNKPIHVYQPSISTIGLPTFSNGTATFTVTRTSDEDWIEYPDDWWDQDGDGIPDPPPM